MGHATPRRSSVLPEDSTSDAGRDDEADPDPRELDRDPRSRPDGDAAQGEVPGEDSDDDVRDDTDGAEHASADFDEDEFDEDESDDEGARRVASRGRRVRADEVLPSPSQAGQHVAMAGAVALLVALAALALGGGAGRSVAPGLPDPGVLTGWGLPLTEVVAQFAAALVVGNLLAAVLWSPSPDGGPAVTRFHCHVARSAAAVWTVAAVAIWLFTLSDIRGVPVSGILDAEALGNLGLRTSAGQAGLATVLAAAVATALSRRAPVTAVLVALLGVLSPTFVESTVSTADHRYAISSAALETLALTTWLGTLCALLLRAARDRTTDSRPGGAGRGRMAPEAVLVAARRFGRIALVGVWVAVVAIVVSAIVVLGPSDTGLDSAYGRLIALSLAALGIAGAIGRWRTTQTVPALGRSLPGPFVRFAALELTVLGALVGLSAATARTPSPLESGEGLHHETPGVAMLGFDMPPSVSFAQLASDWRPDVLFVLFCVAAGVAYGQLAVRARRAGAPWATGRTVAWFAGLAVVVVATCSGVGRYAPVFFSVTIIQHVFLAVVAPLLLTRGAPLTLTLRALRPAAPSASGAVAGPREWVLAALRSRAARILTAPGTVVALWVLGLAGIYFTGVFEATRWSYAADLAVQAYLLGAGSLLFWWLIGPDPRPAGRRTDATRAGTATVAALAAVVAGVLLAKVVGVVAADWWIGLLRVLPLPWPWGSRTAADDQAIGGALLAAVPAVVLLAIAADRLLAATLARRRPSGE
ncbi:cytochrome c oxidase assembly protein [Cryptosporangium sp. NPDC048952]|uniref:cytochrome c oxidase assembly protein n=1 Tax=Cryptosporangium sp. NPDC048952 TaxID=3363961 RepID=UPI003716D44A